VVRKEVELYRSSTSSNQQSLKQENEALKLRLTELSLMISSNADTEVQAVSDLVQDLASTQSRLTLLKEDLKLKRQENEDLNSNIAVLTAEIKTLKAAKQEDDMRKGNTSTLVTIKF
jgi:chromosome segregation ATPase